MRNVSLQSAYTLIEIIIVLSIILILATSIIYESITLSEKARAEKIAKDLKVIESAWQAWRTDTHHLYPKESSYSPMLQSCSGTSPNNVSLSNTDLYNKYITSDWNSNWNGPYLDAIIKDPLGNEYAYDRDGETANNDTCATVGYGTNIVLEWCPENDGYYIPLLEKIDKLIDSSDSTNPRCEGKIKWITTTTPRRLFYMIDRCKGNSYSSCD